MEIGSIVQCVNDSGLICKGRVHTPVKGRLYTVIGFCTKYDRGEGIYIEECSDIIQVLHPSGKIERDLTSWLKSRFVEVLPPMKISIIAGEEVIS